MTTKQLNLVLVKVVRAKLIGTWEGGGFGRKKLYEQRISLYGDPFLLASKWRLGLTFLVDSWGIVMNSISNLIRGTFTQLSIHY